MDEFENRFLPLINDVTLENGNVIYVKEEEGVEGQGNDDPKCEFQSHLIVEYDNYLFDPSYGTSKKGSPLSWEEASISAFGSRLEYEKVENGISMTYVINWVGYVVDNPVIERANYLDY